MTGSAAAQTDVRTRQKDALWARTALPPAVRRLARPARGLEASGLSRRHEGTPLGQA